MCDLGVKKKQVKLYLEGNPRQFGLFMFCFDFFFFFHLPVCLKVGGWQRFRWGITRRRKKKRVKRRKSTAAHTERKDYTKLVVMNRKEGSIGGPSQIQFRLFYKQIFPFCRATGSTWVERQQQPGKYSKNREEKDFVFRNQPTNTHTHTIMTEVTNGSILFAWPHYFPFKNEKKKSNNKERIAVQRL